eukprot:Nk52_evm83s1073 gene=Nk52_evmTU83s1073
MYYDLNVPYKKDPAYLESMVLMLIRLGYDAVAFNHVCGKTSGKIEPNPAIKKVGEPYVDLSCTGKISSVTDGGKLATRGSGDDSSRPVKRVKLGEGGMKRSGGANMAVTTKKRSMDVLLGDSVLKSRGRKFTQLSRLTMELQDSSQTFGLHTNNQVLGTYDLVAVVPGNEKVFQMVCSTLDVDIISFDFSRRIPFYFKMPPVGLAIERGLYFEITYSASIRDSSARRNLFHNAASLLRATKGKNVIISSAAERALDLRTPFDIANLATLFGLNCRGKGLECVSKNCKGALARSRARTAYKSVLVVRKEEEVDPSTKAKVKLL